MIRAAFQILLAAVLAVPALATAATVEYIHTDALGSPVAVTNSAGQVIERREYEPYGRQLAPAALTNEPGYTGHVTDAVTGLTYMQQRYLDPMIGRFLSVDPVTAHAKPGQNFNRYWYGNNNPYKFTDPDGRRACGKNTGCQLAQGASGGAIQVGPPSQRSGDNVPRSSGSSSSESGRAGAVAAAAAGVARPAAGVGGAAGSLKGIGALIRGLLGRAVVTAPLVIGGDSRQMNRYVHYGYAADAQKFAGGLRPGGYATLPGLGYTGEQAQQMLALPHQFPPDAFYSVLVSPSVPVIGPMPVQPTTVPPRTGGGVEFIFPEGTPPGSVTGPYPLPGN